jgi:ligand-binding sensor domain-containing protein
LEHAIPESDLIASFKWNLEPSRYPGSGSDMHWWTWGTDDAIYVLDDDGKNLGGPINYARVLRVNGTPPDHKVETVTGQVGNNLPKENIIESKIISAGQPKLLKTQGSQKGDNVNSSLQDKEGNLWLGTTGEGIYKYDGKSFSQFTVTNGLNSNSVTCLLEDKAGKIWIGTEAGLCLYDGKTFATVQIPLRKNMPPNTQRNTHNVFSIMQDESGKLWFATIDGVYIYDGKTFTPFIVKEEGLGFMSSNHNVEYMLEDKAGSIWFGGRNNEGVYRYDGKTITNHTISEQKDFNWAWPALHDKKGNI